MSHRTTLTYSLTSFGLALLAFAAPASAHINLLDPAPRYVVAPGSETGIKSCPCGLGGSNRTCNVAQDGSDPDRSDRVSRFEAGSTITLRFEEFVDHVGSFRVAFDSEGADFADFNGNILVPLVVDPAGGMGNVGEGAIWEIDVELPDMICNNCTLQLIQAMNGDMVNPVTDPANVSSYYACVDLELVAPGTLDEGEPGDDMTEPGGIDDPMGNGGGGGATSGGGMGTGGAATTTNVGALQPMTGASGNSALPSGNAATASAGGTGAANMQSPAGLTLGNLMQPESGSSSGGCSLTGSPRSGHLAALVAAGLLSAFAFRRRGRREQRA